MTLTAIIDNFDVELTDTDRHAYESLALRLARPQSESEEYLPARLLAYLLEFKEGIAFGRSMSELCAKISESRVQDSSDLVHLWSQDLESRRFKPFTKPLDGITGGHSDQVSTLTRRGRLRRSPQDPNRQSTPATQGLVVANSLGAGRSTGPQSSSRRLANSSRASLI